MDVQHRNFYVQDFHAINKIIKIKEEIYHLLKYDDAYIELVEEFDYETKEELKERESHWIRNNPCVNKQIPDRTYEEWCQDNKHHLAEKKREYRKTERQIKYNKEYYQKNKKNTISI